jgi:hypothetical protein
MFVPGLQFRSHGCSVPTFSTTYLILLHSQGDAFSYSDIPINTKYSNVFGFYSRWNFIALQKVNTQLLITINSAPNTTGATNLFRSPNTTNYSYTVNNSSNTRTRPTWTVSEHLTHSSNQQESVAKYTRTSRSRDLKKHV